MRGDENMWKVIFILCCFLLVSCSGLSKGLINVKPEFTALKANEDVNAIKGEVQDLKAELSVVKGNLTANANAMAGVNNEVQRLSAGRDMVTTTTNDTKLMTYIVKGLIGLCTTLIGILGWCLKTLIKRDKEKKFYKEQTLLKVNSEDELIKLRELHNAFVKKRNKSS